MKWRLDEGQIEVVDEAMADVLRARTPGERMELVAQAWRGAREWVTAGVASQHPEWDESAVLQEVNRRFLGGAA